MKKIIFVILLLLLSGMCQAADPSAATKVEIAHLFSFLENSGCQLNRNGSWYGAKEAVAHLNKKYQYLLGKDMISTTESFIRRAASESSISGKPYLVKCHGRAPVQSADWFMAELAQYRKVKGK
jgi:hypothetical protein